MQQLKDRFGGSQVLELALAQVLEGHLGWKRGRDELIRDLREQGLLPMPDGLQPCHSVKRRTEVVAPALLGGSGMQGHADFEPGGYCRPRP